MRDFVSNIACLATHCECVGIVQVLLFVSYPYKELFLFFRAIENAAKDVYMREYEKFKTIKVVKITKPAENWAQCKLCTRWRLIVSDQPDGSERKCEVFNVLSR